MTNDSGVGEVSDENDDLEQQQQQQQQQQRKSSSTIGLGSLRNLLESLQFDDDDYDDANANAQRQDSINMKRQFKSSGVQSFRAPPGSHLLDSEDDDDNSDYDDDGINNNENVRWGETGMKYRTDDDDYHFGRTTQTWLRYQS
jgi:hypothetical protein